MRWPVTVNISCVGKLRDSALSVVAADYRRRIQRYVRLDVFEEAHEKVARGGRPLDGMVRRFLAAHRRVVLTPRGRVVDSPGFARLLGCWLEEGHALSFVIGGPDGVPPAMAEIGTDELSLSPCTFPHELFRVILLEQMYRACTILSSEPYHR